MSDTGPAKLPGLFALRTSDSNVNNWAQAVNEHLEVRNGSRGNASEKAVLQRDMDVLIRRLDALTTKSDASAAALTTKVDQINSLASTATTAPATSSDGWKEEVSSLRASMDALSRRISAAGTAPYASTFAYGDGPYGQKWFLRSDTALSGSPGPVGQPQNVTYGTTVGDMLNLISSIFSYGDGPFGKRWYLRDDAGLSAVDSTIATGYNTNVGDILKLLTNLMQRIVVLEARP